MAVQDGLGSVWRLSTCLKLTDSLSTMHTVVEPTWLSSLMRLAFSKRSRNSSVFLNVTIMTSTNAPNHML